MTVRYHGAAAASTGSPHLHVPARRHRERAARPALRSPAGDLDRAIGQLLIGTLTPLAIEAALQVSAELEHRAAEADALRAAHVERAQYHADLARRRYLAVDPANRLVAGTLEADWNTALRALSERPGGLRQGPQASTPGSSPAPRRPGYGQLATDLPAIWNDPATPAAGTQAHRPAAAHRRHRDQDHRH